MADQDINTFKTCTRCKVNKPIINFGKRKASKDGFHLYCKVCKSIEGASYFLRNRSKIIEKNKKWFKENPEKTREYIRNYQRKWRLTDPEGYKNYIKKYRTTEINRKYSLNDYYKNKAARLESARLWRIKNPEITSAISRKWRELNHEQVKSLRWNYKARKRGAVGSYSAADIKKMYKLQTGRCPVCRIYLNNKFHIDHVMPLVLGGSNWPSNLQLLCAKCNLKKSSKDPVKFMQENGLLI